ncbi:MAG TPA: IPT/TIG domain-containing protein [Thermoanaerobaculia bacterium]|nr:IPT/TIG domain-containing protein [Thermoanaerobaculia bacterium]
MKQRKRHSIGAAVIAGLMILGGCKSESPTAPAPIVTPTAPGGGIATALTVTVQNPNPVISTGSTSTGATTAIITATVTQSGAAAPNGTAVEFSTSNGVFADTGTSTTIRVTSGGVATASLTSTTSGPAVVTVRVADIRQTTNVTFTDPTANLLVITDVSPATGTTRGGTTVTITGRNFQAPLRVLFGGVEALIISSTSTSITVIVPPLPGSVTFVPTVVPITVISQAGSTNEQRASATTQFTYQPEIVNPVVTHVAPSSGPNEGRTRVVIFGQGFQLGARVFFGTGGTTGSLTDQVELDVVSITPNQIVAITPPALGLGAPLLNQQVTLRVLNVLSNTEVITPRAFRYGPGIVITSAGPTEGSFLGGTRVTIDGQGFDDPVAVTIGGVAAQVIRVSGTQIVAITSGVQLTGCGDITGPIVVTNIEDGSTATGPPFIFRVVAPTIVAPGQATSGAGITVRVFNADPVNGARFTIGGRTVASTFTGIDSSGASTFAVTVPGTLTFPEVACTIGGVAGLRFVPAAFDIAFENRVTTCNDTLTGGITVLPPDGSCRIPPPATLSAVPATVDPATGCADTGRTAATPVAPATGTTSTTITISNASGTGAQALTGSITLSGADATDFTVAPTSFNLAGGASTAVTVTFNPSRVGTERAILRILSSASGPQDICVIGVGQ